MHLFFCLLLLFQGISSFYLSQPQTLSHPFLSFWILISLWFWFFPLDIPHLWFWLIFLVYQSAVGLLEDHYWHVNLYLWVIFILFKFLTNDLWILLSNPNLCPQGWIIVSEFLQNFDQFSFSQYCGGWDPLDDWNVVILESCCLDEHPGCKLLSNT